MVLLSGDQPVLGIVLEVQLGTDARKRFSWPAYVMNLRARLRCPTCLLVVAPSAEIARWCAQPIEAGPGWSFRPFVLGPDAVPIIADPSAARGTPELAVLSAVAHGASAAPGRAFEVAVAALGAVAGLEGERVLLYSDLIYDSLGEAARKALEAMDLDKYEFQSAFAKRFLAQGRSEGLEKGRAEGEAQALLQILQARDIPANAEQRARILSCTDLEQLNTWIRRGLRVRSAAELFES
ncbi:MAG: hypothetical protein MJD61_07410 [Proteobacteria bacterium]|nr:hypothetical protein [Pseudomonadota bacterium]